MTEEDYCKHLCRKGWIRHGINDKSNKEEYTQRILNELNVIHGAKLEGYFLIVQDYINYAKNQGWLVGPGRGSVGGSLVAYLIGITTIDPIQYGLIFERFYNAGRNTEDRVSLPDIDVDFPKYKRPLVIEYIRQKYGEDKVSQMATFGRLMGRGALKEVLRIHDVCDFQTMNSISKLLPRQEEISDKLKEAEEDSIIIWTLKHDPKSIADYCRINEDGSLSGEYAQYFLQASRIEGTNKSQGRHAAGIIVSPEPLAQMVPMVRSKDGGKITGFEMNACEDIGLVKLDCLGLEALDKLMGVNQLLLKGRIEV
jgi:DNA polymerase-3 subunit alpha